MNKPDPIVELKGISAAYGKSLVLSDVSFTIDRNSRWAVIGPNGAGKSTLIKIIAGLVKPIEGTVLINKKNRIESYPARKRGRLMSYMPQKPEGIIPYTVYDFVMLGRYAYTGLTGIPTTEDRKAVSEALDICDIGHLSDRFINTLSGGELQRVLLAGAVAQCTPILLLDEPTTFLDPSHEQLFLNTLSRLHNRRELTTVMITHDINNALLQCTHIAALQNGKIVFSGPVDWFRQKCPEILENLFGVRFRTFSEDNGEMIIYGSWEKPCL